MRTPSSGFHLKLFMDHGISSASLNNGGGALSDDLCDAGARVSWGGHRFLAEEREISLIDFFEISFGTSVDFSKISSPSSPPPPSPPARWSVARRVNVSAPPVG